MGGTASTAANVVASGLGFVDSREINIRMALLQSTDLFLRYLSSNNAQELASLVRVLRWPAGELVDFPKRTEYKFSDTRACLYYLAQGEITVEARMEGDVERGQYVVMPCLSCSVSVSTGSNTVAAETRWWQ